jgi:recombination protein RecA
MASPFRTADMDLIYGHGISKEGGLIDLGVEHGFVRKSGAWYTYEGDQLGQGKENARNFLKSNPDIADEIEKKIKEKLGVGPRIDQDAGAAGAPGNATPASNPPATQATTARRPGAKGTPKPGDI